jgi:hypothetical protein
MERERKEKKGYGFLVFLAWRKTTTDSYRGNKTKKICV